MKTIDELCALAGEQIEAGKLPIAPYLKSVSGERLVKDHRCSLCDEFIKATDFEYRLIAVSKITMTDQYIQGLHFQCHLAWQLAALQV